MKKTIRIMALLVMAMIMSITTKASALTATYYWDVAKNPGSSTADVDIIKIPSYTGTLTYTVSTMNGDCTCLIAKAESANNSKYYINNLSRNIMLTVVGAKQNFTMIFTEAGKDEPIMQISCTIIQNADISKLVYGSGTIYY